jgi:class 3 adenylate cyclase
MPRPIRYVTTSDGVAIARTEAGAGPPYLFVRGWITHLELMDEEPAIASFFEPIEDRFRVIRFDARGNGLSDRHPPNLDLDGFVADVEAVAADLPDPAFVLHGSAFGGPIAIEFAARRPERVSHLILDGTYASGSDLISPSARAAYLSMLELLSTQPDAIWAALAQMTGPEPPHARTARIERARQSIDPTVAIDLYTLALDIDVTARLGGLHMPTLILHSRGNHSFSLEGARDLASRVPEAELVTLSGEAANLWDGDASRALEAIGKFLGVGRLAPHEVTPPAHRAPLVVLFTDMIGSTQILTRSGDAAARSLMRAHDRMVRHGIEREGGRIVKSMGDGFLATFPSVTTALLSCTAIQQEVSRYNEAHPAQPIHVRMGVNAGEAIVEDDDVYGVAVNLAARLVEAAGSDQILVSGVVQELAAGGPFAFEPAGSITPRGFDHEVAVAALDWRETN